MVTVSNMTIKNHCDLAVPYYPTNFFPIHDSVPKAQKSQGQGLANEVSFFVYGSFATVVRVWVRVSCPRADISPTFLTCLRKVILRDILN